MSKIKYSDGTDFYDVTPSDLNTSNTWAMVTRVIETCTDVTDMWKNFLSGKGPCCGSVNMTSSTTNNGVTIPSGWYNYIFLPHRNGNVSGDNCRYGTILLFSFTTTDGAFWVRITGSSESITAIRELLSGHM